ncbi:hypothetical protein EVAR_34510_1 [Eumeta japonica]|uniref:Uncharacterized protein n=1 Tax=Eumeta variegata TaxID=151549 RepID=A0A4C1Z2N5_EUMVA|nr:hypothetical protein EVAR_34510_1 [Eumeta japonica]
MNLGQRIPHLRCTYCWSKTNPICYTNDRLQRRKVNHKQEHAKRSHTSSIESGLIRSIGQQDDVVCDTGLERHRTLRAFTARRRRDETILYFTDGN